MLHYQFIQIRNKYRVLLLNQATNIKLKKTSQIFGGRNWNRLIKLSKMFQGPNWTNDSLQTRHGRGRQQRAQPMVRRTLGKVFTQKFPVHQQPEWAIRFPVQLQTKWPGQFWVKLDRDQRNKFGIKLGTEKRSAQLFVSMTRRSELVKTVIESAEKTQKI